MLDANVRIIEDLKIFLSDCKNKRLFTKDEKAFTKNRKLTYERTVALITNMLKRSLSVEIDEFFELLDVGLDCTKSAFVQQRLKLKHDFFMWWNVVQVESFYYNYKDKIKRWQGYRVMAVDGSSCYLINNPEVKAYFGTQVNQSTAISMGRAMGIYDVLNEIMVSSHLFPIRFSEKAIINKLIPYYESDMLFLYDRGFPSYTTIYLHMAHEKEVKFVMRCRSNFNKEVEAFVTGKKKSKLVEFIPNESAIKEMRQHEFIVTKQTKIKVRLVKVFLDTGETEILITNLCDNKLYPTDLFKQIYFMRWGIETEYEKQKNTLQLEIFSGHKVETIFQDYYANMLVANLQSIISKQCEQEIILQTGHRKHKYKINRNVAIGTMKHKIVKLFLNKDPSEIIEELGNIFLRHIEPIRPDRKYKRSCRAKRLNGKYQTYTNYKRAV